MVTLALILVGPILMLIGLGVYLREKAVCRRLSDRAKDLAKQGHHSEAYKMFEEALHRTPESRAQMRSVLMLNLAIQAKRIGQPGQCLKWSRELIKRNPEPTLLIAAHGMASNALVSAGRYDEATTHLCKKRDIALHCGQPSKAAGACGALAGILVRQGMFEEAIKRAQESLSGNAPSRTVFISLSKALSGLGRFEEARNAMLQARAVPPFKNEHVERTSQAVLALSLSWIEANMRLGDQAWQHLQEAQRQLANDEQYQGILAVTVPWILAVQGRTQEAMEAIGRFEAQEPKTAAVWPPAPGAQPAGTFSTFPFLGRAAFELGDYRKSADYWTKRLSQKMPPSEQPIASYYLGESLARLRENAQARESFQRCINLNIPSYYSGLAAQRLQEMGAAPTLA